MTTSRLSAAALLAGVTILLGACSGAEPVPAVASWESPPTAATAPADDATGAAASPAGDSGYPGSGPQPQLRLDDPPDRHGELLTFWDRCLLDNGARPVGKDELFVGAEGRDVSTVPGEPIPDSAKVACAHLLPLQPVELDPARNPQYREDFLAWVGCLRENGIMVHAIDDASGPPGTLGWTYDESAPTLPDNQGEIEQTCLLQAFGGAA